MSNITSTAATAPITKLNKLKTQFRAFTLHYQLFQTALRNKVRFYGLPIAIFVVLPTGNL